MASLLAWLISAGCATNGCFENGAGVNSQEAAVEREE